MADDVVLDRVFASLPADVRGQIRAMATTRSVARGHTLFRAGDEADGLYVVLSGRIRVSRETHGRVGMLHVEEAGGVLGEIPVFGGGCFPATAIAIAASRCAKLPRSGIERLLRDSPEFSRYALQRLATRAQSLLTRIDELTALTITTRVARHALRQSAGGAQFTLGMSQAALAEELGTAREVVVRAIGALVRLGALHRVGRSRFAVGDAAALRALAAATGTDATMATPP